MEQTTTLIRLPQVITRTGLGRASIYRFVRLDRFPQPVQIGDRASAWVEREVETWIAERVDARKPAG